MAMNEIERELDVDLESNLACESWLEVGDFDRPFGAGPYTPVGCENPVEWMTFPGSGRKWANNTTNARLVCEAHRVTTIARYKIFGYIVPIFVRI